MAINAVAMNKNQEDRETVNKQEDDQHQHDMETSLCSTRKMIRRVSERDDLSIPKSGFYNDMFLANPAQSGWSRTGHPCNSIDVALLWLSGFNSLTVVAPSEQCKSLAATTIEMLDNGFYKSYDELYAVLFDRPSQAIIGYPHSTYAEGSTSHSEAPQVFNVPPLKNDVSVDISEHGKNPFVDSASPQQREEMRKKKLGSSSLHLKALEGISYGSNGLHADGINSPPGQYVSSDNTTYVVNQQWEEYKGGKLDRKKRDHISDGLNEIHSYGINSPMGQHVSIDIQCVVNQQWKEYIGGELQRNKRDYSKIGESTVAITGQAVGSLLSSAFSGSSPTSNFVAVATVFGMAFTISGIGLSRVNPRLSGIMIKLGAVATASVIILALGSTVVPSVAWTAGAVACLLIAIGVVMS